MKRILLYSTDLKEILDEKFGESDYELVLNDDMGFSKSKWQIREGAYQFRREPESHAYRFSVDKRMILTTLIFDPDDDGDREPTRKVKSNQ